MPEFNNGFEGEDLYSPPLSRDGEQATHFGYQSIPVTEKTKRVAQVFHSVAKNYDKMNDLMSLGLHRLWKRQAIAALQVDPHHKILDLAGGTGDLTELILKKFERHEELNKAQQCGSIILSDINASMQREAAARFLDKGILKKVEYVQANAECLPFPDNFFHRIIIGFGLRNVTDKHTALAEMHRVLKPGGRLVILEFSEPQSQKIRHLYDLYSFTVLPFLGKWIAKDSDSYQYLAESIRRHPNQETLKSMMEQVSFERVEYQNIHDGIVAIHKGLKF